MNEIFKYALNPKVGVKYMTWFVNTFPETEFKDDERLMYSYMEYISELDTAPTANTLDVWLDSEMVSVMRELNIHVVGTEQLSFNDPSALETARRITSDVIRDNYKVLSTMPIDENNFAVEMSAWMSNALKTRTIECMSNGFSSLQGGEDASDTATNISEQLQLITDIYDKELLSDFMNTPSGDTKPYFVTDFDLAPIDSDSGGIWSKQLIGIEAQPGTCKTRYTLALCYTAAVKNGKNVLYYNLEQSREEIEAMLIAKHVFNMFGKQINDNLIWKQHLSDELQQFVDAARIDLFESGKYGKIQIECPSVIYVETFIQKIKNTDKLKGPFDLIAIDYMGLIDSKPAKYKQDKTLYEIIKMAFRLFKRYVRATNKAGIAVSQFNKEGVAAGKSDKEITPDMAEGGMAVFKNTDYNVEFSMTSEMRLQNVRRVSQAKVRGSAGFGSFLIDVRLGMLYFKERKNVM